MVTAASKESIVLLPVQRRVLARLVRRAGQREACAFLIGDSTDGRHVVRSIIAVRNTRRTRNSFGIDARALQQLAAPPLGLFHSHARGIMPSAADFQAFDRLPELRCQLIGVLGPDGLRLRAFDTTNQDIAITTP
jgi:proteasome lid subunit RPN8/RPN11